MDALKKYQAAKYLAESNYGERIREAQRLIGEARDIYEEDMRKARIQYEQDTKQPKPTGE